MVLQWGNGNKRYLVSALATRINTDNMYYRAHHGGTKCRKKVQEVSGHQGVFSCKCGATDIPTHYSSFFLFYMFLCMFIHPLIYIIKWSKAPYQQKTEAPSSSVNNDNNIIYNNFRNAGIIYVFNTKRLNQTKIHYITVKYNTIIHHYTTAQLCHCITPCHNCHRPCRHVSTGSSVQLLV